MFDSTASLPSPGYANDTSSSETRGSAPEESATASMASTTSGTVSRISSTRRADASPAAQVFESIVIMTSGVIVVSM